MNITVGKDYNETKIGSVSVAWRRLPSKEEIVDIIVHGPKSSEIRKTWEFKNTSKRESMGKYWFDYVTREVQQHHNSNVAVIPQVLMGMNAKDAEEAIEAVFAHIAN
jgi:hypothetical protein